MIDSLFMAAILVVGFHVENNPKAHSTKIVLLPVASPVVSIQKPVRPNVHLAMPPFEITEPQPVSKRVGLVGLPQAARQLPPSPGTEARAIRTDRE